MKMSISDLPLNQVFFATEPTALALASMPSFSQSSLMKLITFSVVSLTASISSEVGLNCFNIDS